MNGAGAGPHNNNNNNTYKCLINIQPPYVIEKDGEYSGVIYDAWKKVKEKMPEYTFEETMFPTSKNNLHFMNTFNDGGYDVGIGCVAVTKERIKLAYFATPVIMNRCVVLYKDKHLLISSIFKFFGMYFLPYFFALLLLSLILGYILAKTSKQKLSPSRLIGESVAALFGSKGSLLSHVTFNATSIIIIIILLICSTFGLQLLQALITNILAQSYLESELIRSSIHKAKLLGIDNSNVPDMFEKNYECKITRQDDSLEGTIKTYLKDISKYDGIVANGMEALYYAKKYDLKLTQQYFTLNQHGWIVNFKQPQLLQKLNETIRVVLDSDHMGKTCKMNFGEDEGYMCIF